MGGEGIIMGIRYRAAFSYEVSIIDVDIDLPV